MAADLMLSSAAPTKTYVVEAHTDHPREFLVELAGAVNVRQTDDTFLFKVNTEHGTFWVDQLNPRFWSFHTDMRSDQASPTLDGWVRTRHDLDWMWLPSEHLRHVWPNARTRQVRTDFRSHELLGNDGADTEDLSFQLKGRNAEAFLDFISGSQFKGSVSFDGIETEFGDPDFGHIREGLTRRGRFAVSGDSFALHTQFVSTVVDRYQAFVEACERKAIRYEGWQSEDGGGTIYGGPIGIRFTRSIPDRDAFLGTLFSSRAPFRLWGVPQTTADGDVEVEAVDLHVGQRLAIDIGTDWMRVYLEADGCGNTIARLVSNLQHRFDAALTLVDPELDALTRSGQTTTSASR
jgi:hypothetical protein